MTHKAVAITIVLFLAALVIGWMHAAVRHFDPRLLLPFLHGPGSLVYDCGGLALIILFIWGLCRILGRSPMDPPDTTSADPPEESQSYDPGDREDDQL